MLGERCENGSILAARNADVRLLFSNVETEVHDVAVLDHVVLALEPQLARLARALLALARHVVLVGDHLCADEAALEVGMDDAGGLEGAHYEEVRYEGYGVAGAALIVDCMTDNRTRTVADVRHAFAKHGGNLGTDGSVAYLFKHVGQFVFAPGTGEEKVMEAALDAGAEDVVANDDGSIEVLSAPGDFQSVRDALVKAKL